jgi:hypothetical protein
LAFLTRCKREVSSTAFGYKNDEISYKLIKNYNIYKDICAMLQTFINLSYKSGLIFEKKKKNSPNFLRKKKVCHVTDFDQLLLENPYDF